MDWLLQVLPKKEQVPEKKPEEQIQPFPEPRHKPPFPYPTVVQWTDPKTWPLENPYAVRNLRDPPPPPPPKVVGIELEPAPYEPKRSTESIFPRVPAIYEVGKDCPPYPNTYGVYTYEQPPDPRANDPQPAPHEWWKQYPTFQSQIYRPETKIGRAVQTLAAIPVVILKAPIDGYTWLGGKLKTFFFDKEFSPLWQFLGPRLSFDMAEHPCLGSILEGFGMGFILGAPIGLFMEVARLRQAKQKRKKYEKEARPPPHVMKEAPLRVFRGLGVPGKSWPPPHIRPHATSYLQSIFRTGFIVGLTLGFISAFGGCLPFWVLYTDFEEMEMAKWDPVPWFEDDKTIDEQAHWFAQSVKKMTIKENKRIGKSILKLRPNADFDTRTNADAVRDPTEQYGPLDGGAALDDWLEAWDYDWKPDLNRPNLLFGLTSRVRPPKWLVARGWARDRYTESKTLRQLEDLNDRFRWEHERRIELEANRYQTMLETGRYQPPVDLYDLNAIQYLPDMRDFPREYLPFTRKMADAAGNGNYGSIIPTRPPGLWWAGDERPHPSAVASKKDIKSGDLDDFLEEELAELEQEQQLAEEDELRMFMAAANAGDGVVHPGDSVDLEDLLDEDDDDFDDDEELGDEEIEKAAATHKDAKYERQADYDMPDEEEEYEDEYEDDYEDDGYDDYDDFGDDEELDEEIDTDYYDSYYSGDNPDEFDDDYEDDGGGDDYE